MACIEYTERTLLLKRTAQMLRMPRAATSTALTLLHRYMQTTDIKQIDLALAGACLLLASKVEEAPIKTVDLINALKAGSSVESDSLNEPSSKFEALIGERCAAVQQEIQQREQILLREIAFDLNVEDGQRTLLNLARSMGLDARIVRLASFLCNDSLVYTDACICFKAAEIAAGCLLAACEILKFRKIQESQRLLSLPSVPQCRQDKSEEVANLLLDMLKAHCGRIESSGGK